MGLPLLVAVALALLLASTASADKAISQPGEAAGQTNRPQGLAVDFETVRLYVADQRNNRIDVFEADGSFAFAFGWGVVDGEPELQSCGPKASPPTASCRSGLEGAGAGEFGEEALESIAVDNDPTSPSYHDVYTVELDKDSFNIHSQRTGGYRVQKFDPEGHFLLTFGGGVITGGASGTGNLTAGSKEVTSVTTASKTFEHGQEVESPGKIAAGTKIVGVGNGTITLSKPAIGSGAAAPLSVAEGPGNVPTNETYTVVNEKQGTEFREMNFRFTTAPPSPSELETKATIPSEADGAELQAGLEALPNIGPGNVKVTSESIGPEKHEFTLEFSGTRFADTNVLFQAGFGSPAKASVVRQGAGAAEVCAAAIAKSCSGGIEGTGHGQFYEEAHLAVGPGGVVYVVDCIGKPHESGGICQNRLQKFEPSGVFVEQIALPQESEAPGGIAVDSSGAFYVSYGDAVFKYAPSGSLADELPVALDAGEHVGAGALAVDPFDDLFLAEEDFHQSFAVLAEFDSSGNTLRRFGYDVIARPAGLAPAPGAEAVYSSEGESVMLRDFPPTGPLIRPKPCSTSFLGNAKATLLAEVNPEGKETSVHFQYVDQKGFEEEGGFASPNTKTTSVESLGSDSFIHQAHGEATLVPETAYRCRVIVTDSESHTVFGEEGSFTTKKPLELGATTVSDVGTEEATLSAEIDPLGIPTTGFFEYVQEATYLKDIEELGPEHGFDHATKVPNVDGEAEAPLDFGATEELTTRSAHISGLKPGTAYRFRIVAEDPFPAGHAKGPAVYLRTFAIGESSLPDQRAWELVSPPDKNGGDVVATPNTRGLIESNSLQIQAGAASGESVTYTSWTSFGQAQGAPATSQYLSKRTPSGWQTENVSPGGFQSNVTVPPYLGFSPDLRFGAAQAGGASLAPGCPTGLENLYFREADAGTLRCLTPEAPNTAGHFGYCFLYAGSSEDGARVFFKARVPYANAPAGSGASLYEWHEGKLSVLSVLPGQSEPVAPTPRTSFGAYSAEGCQTGQSVLRHAISADGTRAIWTFVPTDGTKPSQLLDRINGTETVQLDAVQSGNASKPGNGLFWAASSDGSVVYFTDENKLISQVKAEAGAPDLYRYDFSKPIGQRLTDLTKGSVAGNVQGVLGASDDGSRVYYVAKAALTPEAEENEAAQHSEAGKYNLYLYDATEAKTKFVAILSGEDSLDWETQPKSLTARVTPDGHLAFLSIESQALAGYDNLLAAKSGKFAGGEHCQLIPETQVLFQGPLCPQAFVYDAQSGKLACASCNPSWARPLGPSLFPTWTNVYEGPRVVSDNGRRLLFESFDRLSDADENVNRDVYEFEFEGEGNCTSESPAFDSASGGCHSLISNGRIEDESYLVDSSSNGRDVFFSTRSPLVGWDVDQNYDVYDAREGGGFPEPPLIDEPCGGEGCLPPAPSSPSGPSPTTPHFQSPGNLSEATRKPRCPKGKRAVHGRSGKPRCVKQHKGKKHHKRGRRQ